MQKRNKSRSLWTEESLSKSRKQPTVKTMSLDAFKAKTKTKLLETDIQQNLMKTLSKIPYKGLTVRNFIYAVPNGGFRSKRTASVLKAEGVKSGIPDLHCFVAVHPYHSLYIEMKTETGDLTESQKSVIPMLRREGHKVLICRSEEQALNEILKYLGIAI